MRKLRIQLQRDAQNIMHKYNQGICIFNRSSENKKSSIENLILNIVAYEFREKKFEVHKGIVGKSD